MNGKLIHIISTILSSLLMLLCNGCRQCSIEINALPFQESEGNNWGLIATNGEIKVHSGSFTWQPSAVVNGMFSLPDEEGYYRLYQLEHPTQPVSAQRFAQIGHFFEEVTLAQEFPDSPILIINRKGKIINDIGISLHYDIVLAHNFAEGRSLFCTRKGKYGFMDTQGNIAIPPIYDQAYDFHEGMALVGNINNKGEMCYQLIDPSGKICSNIQITPSLLDQQFSCGLMKYSNLLNGKCCYLNPEGETNIFLPDSIKESFRFYHNAAIIQSDHGIGLINKQGELLIAPEYEDGIIAGSDRICLRNGNKWLLADFKGNIKGTDKSYDRITFFYPSGLAIAYSDNQSLWIDREGKPLDNKQYYRIAEDLSALQLAPQVFTRKSAKAEDKPENKKEISIPPASISPKEKQKTVQTVEKTNATSTINNEEWKNISKQNPFYAEASKILSGKLPETDADNRRVILNYVEHLRTSYTTKDIDFLTQLFSEEALIIVGKVIRNAPKMDGEYLSKDQVEYNIKSKRTYLERLKVLFKQNKEIKLKFSDFKIMRHPTQQELYGVTLRQKYSSDLYSDDGYLFLLWDFRDETTPLIHVRTWQPSMLDDQTPLPEKEIFNIRNFNLQ